MHDQIHSRKKHSLETREKASDLLKKRVSEWCDVGKLSEKVCVYTTGSFGRGDASKYSDLDVFIVSLEEAVTDKRLLSGLEEIEILASIVHVNRELGLPEIDGDGGFLKVHSLSDYLIGLGKPEDDANNTFTGRLLLLLESEPLLGANAFNTVLEECVERYWIDFADHADSFLPAFMINDIQRFWRTLCVNYEAGTTSDPAKRRAKNYKLKYSRLLTCFSAILGLQAVYCKKATIDQSDALKILRTPAIDRLETAKEVIDRENLHLLDHLIGMYDRFLSETDCPKSELVEKMQDPDFYKKSLEDAREFGDTMFRVLESLSEGSSEKQWRFFRYLTI